MTDDTFRLIGSGFFLGREKEGDKVTPYPLRNGVIHRGRRIAASNPRTLPLLPTESFLSDPSDGLIADDF